MRAESALEPFYPDFAASGWRNRTVGFENWKTKDLH
jgi:hypothetical protein